MTGRADPFAGSDDLDLSDFAPAVAARPKIDARAVREVSEKHKFPSRAAAHSELPVKQPQRRRRTGRNRQLNLKVTEEAATRFTEIADRRGWGLGEAFEAALEALERSLLHDLRKS